MVKNNESTNFIIGGLENADKLNNVVFVVSLNTKRIVNSLLAITFLFIVLNVLGAYLRVYGTGAFHAFGRMLYLVNMNAEQAIPTYFSVIQLLLASVLFAVIAKQKKINADSQYYHWVLLAILFLFLSIDESISIHERIGKFFTQPIFFELRSVFYYMWVVAALGLVGLFGVIYFKFFLFLANYFKLRFFISGLIYVVGAVGMEIVGGYYKSYKGILQLNEDLDVGYVWLVTIEEFLELVGIILLIKTLFEYVKKRSFFEICFRLNFCVRKL